MDAIVQIANMLVGSVILLVTKPLDGGLTAYLSTTFLVLVAMPGAVGLLISLVGSVPHDLRFDSLIARWFSWCIVGPLRLVWWLIRSVFRQIRRNAFGSGHRQTERTPRGHSHDHGSQRPHHHEDEDDE